MYKWKSFDLADDQIHRRCYGFLMFFLLVVKHHTFSIAAVYYQAKLIEVRKPMESIGDVSDRKIPNEKFPETGNSNSPVCLSVAFF